MMERPIPPDEKGIVFYPFTFEELLKDLEKHLDIWIRSVVDKKWWKVRDAWKFRMKLRAALRAAEIQELPPDVEQRLKEVLASREDEIARVLSDEVKVHKHLDKELLLALAKFGTDKIRAVATSAVLELSEGE
jgi:hypothetical protein